VNGGRSLARSIASNWIGFAVQVIVTFALTPFVLRSLGAEGYGVWSVAVGLSGYYGLLDFGIRSGLTQFIARHNAVGDQEKVNESVSTGVAALAVLGVAGAVATCLLSSRAAGWFGVAAADAPSAGRAVLLLGLGVSAQFVLFPFSAVLTALQRFDVANGIGVATRLGTAAATWWILSQGGGLVGLAAVTAAGSLVDYLLRVVAAFRLMPQLRIRPERASMVAMRCLLVYGVWNIVIAGGIRLISYSDILVIGACLGAAAATPFALAANVVNYFAQMLIPVAQVFFPAFAGLDARGDLKRVRALYISGSRLMLTLASVSATAATVWAADFFQLWIGSGRPSTLTPTIFRVLLAAAVFSTWQRLGCQVLLGMGRVRTLAGLIFMEAAANLALSLWLVYALGPVGVAIGTLAPVAVFALMVHPAIVSRRIRLPLRDYYKAVLPGPIAAAAATGCILFPLRQMIAPAHWASLTMAGALTAAVLTVVLTVAVPETRQRLGAATVRLLPTMRRRSGPVANDLPLSNVTP
jgi:O-antigen/teichoic acid export membrane protein